MAPVAAIKEQPEGGEPQILEQVTAELARRVFDLRKASKGQLQAALAKFRDASLPYFVMQTLGPASQPMQQAELGRRYSQAGRWKSPFSGSSTGAFTAIAQRTQLYVHRDYFGTQDQAKRDSLTLARKKPPIALCNTVPEEVEGWHRTASDFATNPAINAFVDQYAGVPFCSLGEECEERIAGANRELATRGLVIHVGCNYGVLGSSDVNKNISIVDTPGVRQEIAKLLSVPIENRKDSPSPVEADQIAALKASIAVLEEQLAEIPELQKRVAELQHTLHIERERHQQLKDKIKDARERRRQAAIEGISSDALRIFDVMRKTVYDSIDEMKTAVDTVLNHLIIDGVIPRRGIDLLIQILDDKQKSMRTSFNRGLQRALRAYLVGLRAFLLTPENQDAARFVPSKVPRLENPMRS